MFKSEGSSTELEASLKSPIKLGLIGFGNIGRVHFEALTQFPQTNFKVAAVADLQSSDNARSLIGADTEFYADYKQLLSKPEILAVSINTPPSTHYQLVMDALNAGKHVLVEKPPALTVEECQRMIYLANEKGKVLFMAFHARYNPSVEAAKQELTGKNVTGVDVKYAEYALNYHHPDGWIFNPEIAGGGVLIDSGINALSIITDVLPEVNLKPDNVHFKQPENFNVETSAEVDLTFGENGKGHISMDWMHTGPEIREVTFTVDNGDKYTVDIVNNHLVKNGTPIFGEGDEKKEMVDLHSEYKRVYEDFTNHIVQGNSLTSVKELAFIIQAYKIGNQRGKVGI